MLRNAYCSQSVPRLVPTLEHYINRSANGIHASSKYRNHQLLKSIYFVMASLVA